MATKLEDYTKAKQATNQEEVDAQDTRTRLYQSLGYSYGQQMEDSDKQYDKAISQQDRSMLARGMQRSSYAAQTLAGLQDQKAKERTRLGEAMIADYQNRVSQLDEAEAARKFQTSEREAQQAWQSGENEKARAYQTSEREAQQAYSTSERLAQQLYNTSEREAQQTWQSGETEKARAYQTAEREAQQAYSTQERIAQQAYNTGEREAQQAYNTQERIAQQAFTQSQTQAQQAWQSSENALDRAQSANQFAENIALQREQNAQSQANWEVQQAFNERQWEAQQEQWKQEFDYSKMSDDQKLAYNYIVAAAAQDGEVTDALLARAGLTREDYNAMRVKARSSGSGGSGKNKNAAEATSGENPSEDVMAELWDILNSGDNGSSGTGVQGRRELTTTTGTIPLNQNLAEELNRIREKEKSNMLNNATDKTKLPSSGTKLLASLI